MTEPDDRAQLTIHQRMVGVLGELPAIGKGQWNEQQKFAFRGIDDVSRELNPLLAAWGVFYLPRTLERRDATRTTRGGSNLYVVNLHVEFTFYGLAGDSVTASAWGEGTDSGDKATPKAHTGAMKVALVQAFAISTEEQHEQDQDRHTDPETGEVPATVQMLEALHKRLSDWLFAHDYPDEWKQGGWRAETIQAMIAGDRPLPTEPEIRRAHAVLDRAEQAEAEELVAGVPCADCGSTRSDRVVHEGRVVCANRNACTKRADEHV